MRCPPPNIMHSATPTIAKRNISPAVQDETRLPLGSPIEPKASALKIESLIRKKCPRKTFFYFPKRGQATTLDRHLLLRSTARLRRMDRDSKIESRIIAATRRVRVECVIRCRVRKSQFACISLPTRLVRDPAYARHSIGHW